MKLPGWLSVAGGLVALAGLIALVWIQAEAGSSPIGGGTIDVSMAYRWQIAMGPLLTVTAGLILVAVAQMLGAAERIRSGPKGSDGWPRL